MSPRLTLEDLGRHVPLTDPRISPNGDRVALVVGKADYETNQHRGTLVLIDVGTGTQRDLTFDRPRVRHPRWSPCGSQLAFLAADDVGVVQIFLLDLQGGEARKLTDTPTGVQLFAWRPTGGHLAYVTPDVAATREGEEAHNKSFEVGDGPYLSTAAPQPSHLWWIDLDGRDPVRLTSGSQSLSTVQPLPGDARPLDWTPDGTQLVFLSQAEPHPGAIFRLSLERIDVETGQRSMILAGPAALSSPRVSPEGTRVAYLAPTGPEPLFNPNGLFVVPLVGGDPVHVSRALDRDLNGQWLPDGQTLLASGPDRTRQVLWRLPLEGAPERVDLGPLDPTSPVSIARNGTWAFTAKAPKRPTELVVCTASDPAPRRLTSLNAELASRDLGDVEEFTWEGPDGTELDGVLVLPPDFDPMRTYPLVLEIHGGPMGASTRGFAGFHQLLAGEGWLVFCPNYRGSNHRGRAFQRAIVNDAGEGPGRDVMSGVAALRARGIVDDTRMAVTGWSYGGFMTVWLSAHFPEWRAAVAGAAVTDWFDWYNLADLNTWSGFGLGRIALAGRQRAELLGPIPGDLCTQDSHAHADSGVHRRR